jgi:alanine dehydrogenase
MKPNIYRVFECLLGFAIALPNLRILDLNLAKGLNVRSGEIVHPAIQSVFPDLVNSVY